MHLTARHLKGEHRDRGTDLIHAQPMEEQAQQTAGFSMVTVLTPGFSSGMMIRLAPSHVTVLHCSDRWLVCVLRGALTSVSSRRFMATQS